MNKEAKSIEPIDGRQSAGSLIKNILFIIIIATMFVAGFYSLFLASTHTGKTRAFTTDNLIRTAAPHDTEKIDTALGRFADHDLIFIMLDTAMAGTDPAMEFSARNTARLLADSGLVSSVRILYPENDDFAAIVKQNGISHFPAVLAVKKDGGIIQIKDDYSEEYLLFAFNSIWGKKSDCSDNKSAVY